MFLALKKVGVRQYEDSDFKPGVGVITQARRTPTKNGLNSISSGQTGPGGMGGGGGSWPLGMSPGFFFEKGLRWHLVILIGLLVDKHTCQALKQLIFH